jgi:alginate O-acetyltransferase complex protein AlgI
MLFNSFNYLVFLPLTFVIYWFIAVKNLRVQNLFLLLASYFFYSFWDYRFLGLLIFSTLLDYIAGIKMFESTTRKRKRFWFWISIILNLGFLGVFKYYNFFAESFAGLLENIGFHIDLWTLQIILPVGISFYTFHGLSYVIDIYKERIKPEREFVDYAVFVSFFPLLVAGPIERATHLLPQIKKKRKFNQTYAADGLRQILWGLFKKVVIADGCAEFSNLIFNNIENYSGGILLIGAICFAIQIYCDFSGYSDIAIGTAKLFGIDLLKNFSFPYFSRNIAEFWRRWHISLTTWFRDYVYIPLGGSKVSKFKVIRNTFVIFLLSGFWHGANWTFIFWGLLNAIYFMPLLLNQTNRNNLGSTVAEGRVFPNIKEIVQMTTTFSLTIIAWIFFRADNLTDAFEFIFKIFHGFFQRSNYIEALNFIVWDIGFTLPILILFFIITEWFGRFDDFAIGSLVKNWRSFYRWLFYFVLVFLIFQFMGAEQNFIYFQF